MSAVTEVASAVKVPLWETSWVRAPPDTVILTGIELGVGVAESVADLMAPWKASERRRVTPDPIGGVGVDVSVGVDVGVTVTFGQEGRGNPEFKAEVKAFHAVPV